MKKILVIAALVAVSACSKPAPAPEASAAPAATAAAAEPIAADGKSSVGTFKVTDADGKVYMEDVKADGTYASTLDGKPAENGKWEQKSPTLYCYTNEAKDGKDAKQVCNDEKVENGVWTSKSPDGKVSTVERVAS